MRVLLVAAERREFSGLLRHMATTPLRLPVDFARQGLHRGRRWILIANGAGPKLAGAAVDIACDDGPVDAMVSTGFCGGLDPRLNVGDVLTATEVDVPAEGRVYPALAPATSRCAAAGRIISMDRFANADEKLQLSETGAAAVEMEAAAVAGRALARAVPFYCIRVVSDASADRFSLDFNACRDEAGRFSRRKIAAAALRHPWRSIPELARLDRNCRVASRRLGDFLASCGF